MILFFDSCVKDTSGYNCTSGTCYSVSSNSTYTSLSACQSNCGSSAGYDCISGTCQYVSSGASYSTLSNCQNNCTAPYGQAIFYTVSDLSCGIITVNCGGTSQTITAYYPGGSVSCGASSCANFVLSPGTYNYQASCSGYIWNGSVTITGGGCAKKLITI